METSKISLGRNSIITGIILGLTLIIFDLLLYIFNAPFKSPLRYSTVLIIAGFIIYGTITFRDKHNNGFITYGRCFLSGFLIALYGGILFAIYNYLFIKFFDHSIITKMIAIAQQAVADKMPNLDEEKIEEVVQMQKKFMTPFFLSLGALFNSIVWGVIMSLIISIFVKKEDKSIPIDNV